MRTLIHCGDVTSPSTLDLLRGFAFHVCLGNNDSARGLREAAERAGGAFAPVLDLGIGGKRFFVAHGDREGVLLQALHAGGHDYVLYGHTHRRDDRVKGRARLVNPGALYRAPEYSVALLDPEADRLEFVVLPGRSSLNP